MKKEIKKWGNSLALRLPKNLADKLNLSDGSQIELIQEGEKLIIEKKQHNYDLDSMVEGINEENRHNVKLQNTTPKGKEIW